MEQPDPLDDVVSQLVRTTPLSPALAARVVADVVAAFAEPVEQVVRRRHRELQAQGLANPEIFALLADELARRPVAAPTLTERQLRRTIYG